MTDRARRPLLDVLLVGALLVLGAPTLIRLVGDHGRTYLVLAAVLVPLLVLPLLGLTVVQLLLGRRLLAGMTSVLLVLNALWLLPLYVADPVRPGQPLTVLTANLRFGLADMATLVRWVREHDVDVLATEELTADAVDRLRAAGLEQLLPHAELDPRLQAQGSGLWSRYPITVLPRWDLFFAAPGATVATPAGPVVVRVLHPFPTDLTNGGGLYRQDYTALTRYVRALDPAVPTVLAGDLNSSVDNQYLRELMGGRFRDAAEVSGEGVQLTWSREVGGWPLMHLDHVLVDDRIDVRSTRVLPLPGSDHKAVLARLVVT